MDPEITWDKRTDRQTDGWMEKLTCIGECTTYKSIPYSRDNFLSSSMKINKNL